MFTLFGSDIDNGTFFNNFSWRKVFESESEAVETVKTGNDKKGAKMKFLQGLVMRETRGSADPAEVASLVNSMLE